MTEEGKIPITYRNTEPCFQNCYNNIDYDFLNDVKTDRLSENFQKVKNNENNGIGYTNYNDPRLKNALRGNIPMVLNDIPIEYFPKRDIYTDKTLNQYGKHYDNYLDIKEGDITYYINNQLRDPYFYPNFTEQSKVYTYKYTDPMDVKKNYYIRKPIEKRDVFKSNTTYNGCLSFIEDTSNHREDIMSSILNKRNFQSYQVNI
jgi:hypothetical protein